MRTEQEIRERMQAFEKLLNAFGFNFQAEVARLELKWVLGEES